MNRELDLFVCECGSSEHQIIVTKYAPENDQEWSSVLEWNELYFTIHLATLPWWSRVWHGIRYIFGYRCRYGDFEEVILDETECARLAEVLTKHVQRQKTALHKTQQCGN